MVNNSSVMELDVDRTVVVEEHPRTRTQFMNGKLSRVRWITKDGSDSRFITASYGGVSNEIYVWELENDVESSDCFKKETSLAFDSDIRDLFVFSKKRFAVSLNNGSVSVLELNNKQLSESLKLKPWRNHLSAHAVCGEGTNLFVGYSDGTVVLRDLNNDSAVKWSVTDLSSTQALSMMTSNVVVSAHISGTIYAWDTRQKSEVDGVPQPIFSCVPVQLCDAVTAVANHSADPNMVGYGTSSGMVELLDTRLNENIFESNPLPLAAGPVWEVGFHPDYPKNFYGAWSGGHLLHFEMGSDRGFASTDLSNVTEEKVARFSRLGDAHVSELVQNPGSINSFSISSKGILVGSDSAILTLIQSDFYV